MLSAMNNLRVLLFCLSRNRTFQPVTMCRLERGGAFDRNMHRTLQTTIRGQDLSPPPKAACSNRSAYRDCDVRISWQSDAEMGIQEQGAFMRLGDFCPQPVGTGTIAAAGGAHLVHSFVPTPIIQSLNIPRKKKTIPN